MAGERPHPTYLWLNGEILRWENATIHISDIGWSTQAAVFEGMKAYWNADQNELFCFRFPEHLVRFANSMKIQRMICQWTPDELLAASLELLRANETRVDTYVRPLTYLADTAGFGALPENPAHVLITTRPFQTGLGTGRTTTAGVSSWTRISDNVISPRIKCIANYQNSRLAMIEARQHGYDDGIILNAQGKVSEGPGACIFIVRNGVAITPPVTSGILESITRDTVLRICQETLGIPTLERDVDRTELYIADEVFFCGTGAEIKSVSAIDGYRVGTGAPGPITSRVESLYHAMVRGHDHTHDDWNLPVWAKAAVGAPA
jgi:branched-chain amino acid aminotransferase